jgi:hypothetical protein
MPESERGAQSLPAESKGTLGCGMAIPQQQPAERASRKLVLFRACIPE